MKDKIETFTKTETRFLSNFYPFKNKEGAMYPHKLKILFNGNVYSCVENAYVASKTLDKDVQRKIVGMTPFASKEYGSQEDFPLRSDWDDVKLGFMKDFVEQKFLNHSELAKMLLSTKDMTLEEGNDWDDTFWGVDIETREGQNNLGKILMNVRSKLQEQTSSLTL
ncbi:MAG: NADAR family protein [Campylobacterales bacterium]|nr:NADAR family protein [Campylobacterales bacterium]